MDFGILLYFGAGQDITYLDAGEIGMNVLEHSEYPASCWLSLIARFAFPYLWICLTGLHLE